ncbi:MAG: hypothetical protein U5L08_00140 [Xanthomonadales bacterium]|nr:hypothetical protein [Xanthomonadales bacterium]
MGEENALLPEHTSEVLHRHMDVSQKYMEALPEILEQFAKAIHETVDSKLADQNDLISVFKDAVNKREHEIAKLQDGYEIHIFKKGASEIIEVHDFCREILQDDPIHPKDLEMLSKLIEKSLSSLGIQVYYPQIGESVTDQADRISDSFSTRPTKDPEKDMSIAEVKCPAYIFEGPKHNEIIKKSKIEIFKLDYKEGE